MIPYEYPDIFTGTAVQKELLITDGTVTVTDDEYTVTDDTITFETGDFELESFELSQSLMSEMQFTYGCCETGKVRFIVRKHYVNSIIGVELKVYIIPDHDASKMLQLGVFKVNEDKQSDNYNVHSITAYDAMYDILNEDVTDWYNDILEDETSSVTLATFRTSFISFFGLTTESASEPLYNDDLVLKRTIEKDQISGADIIKAICELNGCFGVINNVGEFRYKGLPPNIARDGSTLVLDVPDYMDIQFEDTSFKPIKKVKIVNDGVSATSSQSASGNYNTYTIAYNPLIADYSEAQLQSLANDLRDLFYNHNYLPCTINAIGNPVHEVGDCLEVTTKYGFSVLTYIFERTLKGIQALRDTYRSNGVEYLTDNLNKQSTQTKAVQSQLSQVSQAYANSDTDFVETIRNIGFRLLDEPDVLDAEYDPTTNQVSLKWEDPADISTLEPVPCTWAGTVVVRKANGVPRHKWDGTVIVDSTTRDAYKTTALVDNTVEQNKDYYYGIFPYHVWLDDATNPIKHYRYTKCVKIDTYVSRGDEFDFTGSIQTFTATKDGVYLLEVWGAQGGNADTARGGYGAYATGEVSLQQGDTLYIGVGGQNGWNGGGDIIPSPPEPVVWEFSYTGDIQTFTVTSTGRYVLEVWGASGGTNNNSLAYCGKGGYSKGKVILHSGDVLYIGVGGEGENENTANRYGGYNGGGNGGQGAGYADGSGGGGASHIAIGTNRGTLSGYEGHEDEILIVAGGGGGTNSWWDQWGGQGGSGGGISGSQGTTNNGAARPQGGTQTTGYAFGQGQSGKNGWASQGGGEGSSGAGGGFYGGYANNLSVASNSTGSGGSGYIGNPLLTDKYMVGYNVAESSDDDTKTISVSTYSTTATADTPKKGNGFVRITWI